MKPPERQDEAFLSDIKTSCSTIVERLRRRQLSDLTENEEFRDALFLRLMIIGEAASHLAEKPQHQYPKVYWKNVAELRNVRTYDFLKIWHIATREVPELLALLE